MRALIAVMLGCLCCPAGGAQLLPTPGDGDIRTVYWEPRDVTEILLTIEPRPASGPPAPASLALRFSRGHSGRSDVPAREDTPIDVKAYAGMMWAPQPELWFGIDGDRVDLVPQGGSSISQGPDYLQGATTLAVLKRIGAASSVHGSALGFRFELTGAQRTSFGAFVDRLGAARKQPIS